MFPMIVPAAMYNVGLGLNIRYKMEQVYKLGGCKEKAKTDRREQ